MDRRMFTAAAITSVVGAAMVPGTKQASAQGITQPQEGSTLARILAAKKLRVAGLVGEEPYFHKDIATGEWGGFAIDMARDIAKELGVEVEIVESTWGNSVLDLQADKIDLSLGLAPTPKRSLVIDFTRPVLEESYWIVTRKGFSAATWAELSNPSTKIAVDLGSTHETVAKRYAGKATIIGFKTRDEAVLAVATGKADCFVCTIFLGLAAKAKNPQLGNFVMPTPKVSSAAVTGVAYDNDRRFRDFISVWSEYNRSSGQVRDWIVASLDKIGVNPDDVGPAVQF